MAVRLKFLFNFLVMSLFFIIFSSSACAATALNSLNEGSVAGYWQTIDGKTKKPSSIISIQPNGQFFEGKIVKTYSGTSEKKITICTACKGYQKNKPILGLTIIHHMVCRPKYCSHGTILDPRNGQIYKATMRLINAGQQLKVRGYVGVPMFGKTVIWNRVLKKSAQ